jgi:hypothetical protein
MNKRWAWNLPVLAIWASTLVSGQAFGQAGGPSSMTQHAFGGYDPAMLAAMQQNAMPAAGGQALMPPGAYGARGMYPPGYANQQAAYMAAGPGGPMGSPMPGQYPGGPLPDVNGSYGFMPVNFSGQGQPPGPGGYGPEAYGPPPGYGPPGGGPPGGIYGQPPSGGNGQPPGYATDQFGQQMGMGGSHYEGSTQGGPSCPQCGGRGCPTCMGGGGHGGGEGILPNGLLGDVLGLVAPYPDGGCAAPRWFDFAIDYMMLKRDNTGRRTDFASLGPLGPIVLSSDDLDFGSYQPGFRFTAALQLAAANSLEFNYFGQFNYDASATVRSGNGAIFTAFSEFGFAPPVVGFSETDMLNFAQIHYNSAFDSFEINWRNRWVSPNAWYQGSWTLGVRHFILDEKLRFSSASSFNGFQTNTVFVPARFQFDVDTTNNLTGFQIGGDAWLCVLPGLRLGGELQAGVYGNHINANTTFGSNLIPGDFRDDLQRNDVAFIGQANLLATYRINYQWTLRGGYQFLFVDGVALAPENFNPQPAFVNNPFAPRTTFVNDDGNVFYHGWNVGLEYMW